MLQVQVYICCKTLTDRMRIQISAFRNLKTEDVLSYKTIKYKYCASNMHLLLVQPKEL